MQHNVIVRCRLQYQSVATPPSDGVLRGALKRFFSHCAPAPRIFSGRGTSPGVVNFWRALRAWSFGILAQPAKQSRSRFTKCFEVLSCAALVHGNHHEPEPHGNAQNSHGEIRNVEC
jgi:hypothetical protein